MLIDPYWYGFRAVQPGNRQILSDEWDFHAGLDDGSEDVLVLRRGLSSNRGAPTYQLHRRDTRESRPRRLDDNAPEGTFDLQSEIGIVGESAAPRCSRWRRGSAPIPHHAHRCIVRPTSRCRYSRPGVWMTAACPLPVGATFGMPRRPRRWSSNMSSTLAKATSGCCPRHGWIFSARRGAAGAGAARALTTARAVLALDGALALSTGPEREIKSAVVARFNSIWRQEAPGVWRVVFDKGQPSEPKPH